MGAFFTAVFGTLFGWVGTYLTKKIAYAAAIGASLLAVTSAFYVAVHALIATLSGTITNQYLLMGFYAVLPDNAVTCLSACFTAEVAAFLYRHQLLTLKAVSSAT